MFNDSPVVRVDRHMEKKADVILQLRVANISEFLTSLSGIKFRILAITCRLTDFTLTETMLVH